MHTMAIEHAVIDAEAMPVNGRHKQSVRKLLYALAREGKVRHAGTQLWVPGEKWELDEEGDKS